MYIVGPSPYLHYLSLIFDHQDDKSEHINRRLYTSYRRQGLESLREIDYSQVSPLIQKLYSFYYIIE